MDEVSTQQYYIATKSAPPDDRTRVLKYGQMFAVFDRYGDVEHLGLGEEGVFFEDLSDKVLQDDELSHLLTFPNVLITSHQAFLTHEALSEIARVTALNLVKVAAGESALDGTML